MREQEITRWLRVMCQRYRISYKDNKAQIRKLLDEKVSKTGEIITDTDCKEVCKFIAES
jgi:hypothetical protein